MTWVYGYNPLIWPSLLTVLLLIALAVYSGRRRSVPGALPFLIGCLFAGLWAAGSVGEYAAADLGAKIGWNKFQAACQLPIVLAVTGFILEYAWPGRWLTRGNLALMASSELLLLGLILTNDRHHILWRGFGFDGALLPEFGPGFWYVIAYAYALAAVNLVVFAWLWMRSPQHRWPVVIMLTGLLVGRVVFLLAKTYVVHADLPLDLLGMAFEFLMYAIALFGFHILDPIPLARQTAIEQLQGGMLVLDPRGRVVSLNPAAQRMLGAPAKRIKGRPIGELLPAYAEAAAAAPAGTEIEFSLPPARHYSLEVSPLKDWRGLEAGRLLLLRDVTAQKEAQAQILEQQRALATLREREHLARELHDSIGQVLSFASLKAGATRKLIADGKLARADDQLAHLESIMAEAHADVREYILNLRSAPTAERPFFSALQHYLDGFRQNYAIQVDLYLDPAVEEGLFAPEVQMQLFRILQEAFSNVRKHADADHVRLSFERQDRRVCVRIQDNGQGFDPRRAAKADDSHWGLSFMAERAEQLGGNLRVESVPGQGTCVSIEVPAEGASHV